MPLPLLKPVQFLRRSLISSLWSFRPRLDGSSLDSNQKTVVSPKWEVGCGQGFIELQLLLWVMDFRAIEEAGRALSHRSCEDSSADAPSAAAKPGEFVRERWVLFDRGVPRQTPHACPRSSSRDAAMLFPCLLHLTLSSPEPPISQESDLRVVAFGISFKSTQIPATLPFPTSHPHSEHITHGMHHVRRCENAFDRDQWWKKFAGTCTSSTSSTSQAPLKTGSIFVRGPHAARRPPAPPHLHHHRHHTDFIPQPHPISTQHAAFLLRWPCPNLPAHSPRPPSQHLLGSRRAQKLRAPTVDAQPSEPQISNTPQWRAKGLGSTWTSF